MAYNSGKHFKSSKTSPNNRFLANCTMYMPSVLILKRNYACISVLKCQNEFLTLTKQSQLSLILPHSTLRHKPIFDYIRFDRLLYRYYTIDTFIYIFVLAVVVYMIFHSLHCDEIVHSNQGERILDETFKSNDLIKRSLEKWIPIIEQSKWVINMLSILKSISKTMVTTENAELNWKSMNASSNQLTTVILPISNNKYLLIFNKAGNSVEFIHVLSTQYRIFVCHKCMNILSKTAHCL